MRDYKFIKLDENYYRVEFAGVVIGAVFMDPDAWSDGRWFVEGDRREKVAGGYSSRGQHAPKFRGHRTRGDAAKHLATMASAMVMLELSAREAGL